MQFSYTYATSLEDLVSRVNVTPFSNPQLIHVNQSLIDTLGLPSSLFEKDQLFEALFTKQGKFNVQSVAQKYGGHQFGNWNPELGDGRGLLIGEWHTDTQKWDLHLKGSGQTPYSRFGDGRAVLRSTMREYLASEALAGLGIPTSRSLCMISSDEPVQRETVETAAMMIRVSESHLRFGHYEYFYHSGQLEKLQQLFDYTFDYHYPELAQQESRYFDLLQRIVVDTAHLIALWQAYAFNHGVMNTDNMSIHGITFDFGPYAFLDAFQPDYICNHSDHAGRYAFDSQPGIALWNLNALAHAFTPYLSIDDLKTCLSQFEPALQSRYLSVMAQKIGINAPEDGDMHLINQWLTQLQKEKRDYTQAFTLLTNTRSDNQQLLFDFFIDRSAIENWFAKYLQRIGQEGLNAPERIESMQQVNPVYVLRNYLAQQAIDRANQGDFSEFEALLDAVSNPYDEKAQYKRFSQQPPEWGRGMEISCSS